MTYERDEMLRSGVDVNGVLVDSEAPAASMGQADNDWWRTVTGIIEQDDATLEEFERHAGDARDDGVPTEKVRLGPPVPFPQKIICIGLNYSSHVEEAKTIDGAPKGASPVPILFTKFPTSLVGSTADVRIPPSTEQMDWEAELAVVIGRTASGVSQADASLHVAGYMAFNDVSARDLQLATPQWTAGKACDTFGPCGPALVTKSEITDPQNLRLMARLNGEVMQDASTAQMIFPVTRLIEYISSLITLVPGDIIATGTPSGVGIGRNPQVFMQPGDVIEVEVEHIGTLRNTIVAASNSPTSSTAIPAAAGR